MPISPETIYLASASACALVGSGYDLHSRRVPNWLTGPSILFGLLLHLFVGGGTQMGLSALAGVSAGGLFLLFFLAGGMGAGDVKLMAAVGCLAGTADLKELLLATLLTGGVLAVGVAIYRGRLRQTIDNVALLLQHHGSKGMTAHPELNLGNRATLRLPYAVPIAAGCLLTFLMSYGRELTQ